MSSEAERTFAAIVAGDLAAHRVYEDRDHVAFLAPEPVQPGHVILTTRVLHDYLFDLPVDVYLGLWQVARELAQRMRQRLPCERVCVGVIGWAVRHVHLHLVPTTAPGQFPPLGGTALEAARMQQIAVRLGGG